MKLTRKQFLCALPAAALALAGGLLMTVLSYFLLPGFLVTMGTPVEILDQASTYTRIISLGMLPSLIYNIGSGILRAIGDSRRPLYFLIACCLFNIVADVLLVVGANMGVAGWRPSCPSCSARCW